VSHDAARRDADRAARVAPPRGPPGGSAGSLRDPGRRTNPPRREDDRARRWTDSRDRDGSRHHHGGRAAVRSRDRRGDRRRIIRESSALRRIRGHVADPLRHAPQGQALTADIGRIRHARDRRLPRRSALDLRDGGRRQLDDAGPVLPTRRVLHRPESVSVADGARGARREAGDDEPRRPTQATPTPDPSGRSRVRDADRERARGRRRRGVHAGRRPRPRGTPRRDHGHRDEHGARGREPPQGHGGVVPRGARVRGRESRRGRSAPTVPSGRR
jgi:hypothetical protein